MTEFRKALGEAQRVLKGQQSVMTSDDFESAALDFAKSQRRPDESDASAFVRLLGDRDPIVTDLLEACDASRFNETHRGRFLLKKATDDQLDDYVRTQVRDGETFEKAYVRLMTEHDEEFSRLAKARALVDDLS